MRNVGLVDTLKHIGAFSKDGFIRGLPWILAVLGSICLLIGYIVLDAPEEKVARDLVTALGQATLVGGIFGAVLKSLQYAGVFRKALFDIIYEDRFLGIRGDLDDVWQRLTARIYERKFPELREELHQAIMEEYLPTQKNFYYSSYHRVKSHRHSNRPEKDSGNAATEAYGSPRVLPYDPYESCNCRTQCPHII